MSAWCVQRSLRHRTDLRFAGGKTYTQQYPISLLFSIRGIRNWVAMPAKCRFKTAEISKCMRLVANWQCGYGCWDKLPCWVVRAAKSIHITRRVRAASVAIQGSLLPTRTEQLLPVSPKRTPRRHRKLWRLLDDNAVGGREKAQMRRNDWKRGDIPQRE